MNEAVSIKKTLMDETPNLLSSSLKALLIGLSINATEAYCSDYIPMLLNTYLYINLAYCLKSSVLLAYLTTNPQPTKLLTPVKGGLELTLKT